MAEKLHRGSLSKEMDTTYVHGFMPVLQKLYIVAGVHAVSLPSGRHQQLAHRVLWSGLHNFW